MAYSFMFYICSDMLLLCVNVDLHVFNFVDINVRYAVTVAIRDEMSRDEMSKCSTVA